MTQADFREYQIVQAHRAQEAAEWTSASDGGHDFNQLWFELLDLVGLDGDEAEYHGYNHCPYWQAANGGPKDLPGAYGPGTCMGGCWSEPQCMT